VLPAEFSQQFDDDRTAALEALVWPPKAVLVPCDDEWLLAVAQLLDTGDGRFTSFIPPLAVVRDMIDKGEFATLLDEVAIPRPRTWRVESVDDLSHIDDSALAMCFLKPRVAKRFNDDFGVKAFVIPDRRAAEQQLARALARGHEMILQEFIEGTEEGHLCLDGFVDRTGRLCALVARRPLRTYPLTFGNTTDTVTVPLKQAGESVDHLRRLFEHVGFRGLFEAEFVVDSRTSEHKIIEVNARPWWQIELAAAAGIDMLHMAYLDSLGLDVTPATRYIVGRRWVHTIPDLRSRLTYRTSARVPVERSQAWWRATHAVLDRADPVPGLLQMRRTAGVGLRRLTRHNAWGRRRAP